MKLNIDIVRKCIRDALKEDKTESDITTKSLFKKELNMNYKIISCSKGIACGLPVVKEIFKVLSSKVKVEFFLKEGDSFKKNDIIASVSGSCYVLLSAERVVLNFLSHLSGIATYTSKFVLIAQKNNVKILDTRKTIPGLRHLEKYAVCTGGGINHRMDLNDMFLIKDNHINLITHNESSDFVYKNIVNRLRKKYPEKQIEIEVETLKHFKTVLSSYPDIIMLDNMSPEEIKKIVKIKKELSVNDINVDKVQLEASGGIDFSNIEDYVNTGVDRISIGSLTNSAPALDFSIVAE